MPTWPLINYQYYFCHFKFSCISLHTECLGNFIVIQEHVAKFHVNIKQITSSKIVHLSLVQSVIEGVNAVWKWDQAITKTEVINYRFQSGIIVTLKEMLNKIIFNKNNLQYLPETLNQIWLLFITEAVGNSVNSSSSITLYSYR